MVIKVMISTLTKCNLYRVIARKETYVAILIIIVSSICTLKRNSILYSLNAMDHIGVLNKFIFSCIKNNGIMSVCAPFVVMLVYPNIIFEDIQNRYFDQMRLKVSNEKFYLIQIFESFIISGGIYVMAHLITLFLYYCISPKDSVMVTFLNGPFSNVYYRSLTLYCVLFIVHSFLFGGIIGILGMGLAMNLHNKCILWTLPTLLYYLGFYFFILFPDNMQSVMIYVIPLLPYEITTYDIPVGVHISQLFIITLVGFILIWIGIQRYDSSFKCKGNDSKGKIREETAK